MAHITVPEGAPGIVAPLLAYPETAAPLAEFTQVLMQDPSSCMFNRYVNGLATWASDDPALDDQRVAERGTSPYTQFTRPKETS
ncbi:MAG: hypothetical protein JWL77_5546 [Chthonomonadaceae bacterium]|nr:hypothetical protein [Chthonomonadaceae bacterium]